MARPTLSAWRRSVRSSKQTSFGKRIDEEEIDELSEYLLSQAAANAYLDIDLTFDHFYVRKTMFNQLLRQGMISPEDEDLMVATDDPDEAVSVIKTCYDRRCAVSPAHPAQEDAE